jgi:hypothetical protein
MNAGQVHSVPTVDLELALRSIGGKFEMVETKIRRPKQPAPTTDSLLRPAVCTVSYLPANELSAIDGSLQVCEICDGHFDAMLASQPRRACEFYHRNTRLDER